MAIATTSRITTISVVENLTESIVFTRLKRYLFRHAATPALNAVNAALPTVVGLVYQHRGATDAEAMGLVIATIAGVVVPVISASMTDRWKTLWAEIASDDEKTDREVIEEIRKNATEPAFAEAIMQAANALRNVIAQEAVRPLGLLTREYTRGTPKKPDRFFRSVSAVLSNAEAEDIKSMRDLFAKTLRSDLDGESDIQFALAPAVGSCIQIMKPFVVPPPTPSIQSVADVPMAEPDRISHMLVVHGVAKASTINKTTWGGRSEQSGFVIRRSDCLRLARIFAAAK